MKYRDTRFIAVHRGGPLTREHHRLLALWAADCAERLLPEYERQQPRDVRLRHAIATGRSWARGEEPAGAAMKAAVACHAAAREATDLTSIAIARAAGHAVATAHFADHCLGVAIYALKALEPNVAQAELRWHLGHLPEPVRDLVCSAMVRKLPQIASTFQPTTHSTYEQIH